MLVKKWHRSIGVVKAAPMTSRLVAGEEDGAAGFIDLRSRGLTVIAFHSLCTEYSICDLDAFFCLRVCD